LYFDNLRTNSFITDTIKEMKLEIKIKHHTEVLIIDINDNLLPSFVFSFKDKNSNDLLSYKNFNLTIST
jgi:hypothetical protein